MSRIEAIGGRRALQWVQQDEERLRRVAEVVKGGREDVEERVVQLFERNRRLERELDQLKGKLASAAGDTLETQAISVAGVRVLASKLDGADTKTLRTTLDQLKDKLGSAVVVLAAVQDGKVSLVAGVTKDLTDRLRAGELIGAVAEKVGGRGGGRPDMAQAGGSRPEGLAEGLSLVEGWVRQRLA